MTPLLGAVARDGMNTTPWREHTERDHRFRTRVEWGWRRIGPQDPYLSITHETERHDGRRWHEDSCGAGHETVLQVWPEFAPLLPFHLCGSVGGPMHYLANAIYWWEQGQVSWTTPDRQSGGTRAIDAFQSTCIYGALPEDATFDPCLVYKPREVREWLVARLPALMDEMRHRVEAFGLAVRP